MKKNIKTIFAVAVLFAASSCSMTVPGLVTDNVAEKKGEASAKYILGIFGPMHADLSIATAAKKGGITQVSTVDYKVTGGVFSKTYTTIVTGK